MLKIIGFRHYEFQDKTTQKNFKGITFFVAEEIPKEQGSGYAFVTGEQLKGKSAISVSNDKYETIIGKYEPGQLVGKPLNVSFDHTGKVSKIELAPKEA